MRAADDYDFICKRIRELSARVPEADPEFCLCEHKDSCVCGDLTNDRTFTGRKCRRRFGQPFVE